MFSSLSGVRFLFGILPHLNILCTSSEKRNYTENTHYFKHGIQLNTQFPSSKLRVVGISIGNGTFGGATPEKSLDRLTQNLAEMITSGIPLNTPNGMSFGLGA